MSCAELSSDGRQHRDSSEFAQAIYLSGEDRNAALEAAVLNIIAAIVSLFEQELNTAVS